MSKDNKALIRPTAHKARWEPLVEHISTQAISGDIDWFHTEPVTLSADYLPFVGEFMLLNPNGTMTPISPQAPTIVGPVVFQNYQLYTVSNYNESCGLSYAPSGDIVSLSFVSYSLNVANVAPATLSAGSLYIGQTTTLTAGQSGTGAYCTTVNCHDIDNDVTVVFSQSYESLQTDKFPAITYCCTPVTTAASPNDYTYIVGPISNYRDEGVFFGNQISTSHLGSAHYNTNYGVSVACGWGTLLTVTTETSGGSPSAYYTKYVGDVAVGSYPRFVYDAVNDQYIVFNISDTRFISLSGAGVPYETNSQANPFSVVATAQVGMSMVGSEHIALIGSTGSIAIGRIVGDSITWGATEAVPKTGNNVNRLYYDTENELLIHTWSYGYVYTLPMHIDTENLKVSNYFDDFLTVSGDTNSVHHSLYVPEWGAALLTSSTNTPSRSRLTALTIGDNNFTHSKQFLGTYQGYHHGDTLLKEEYFLIDNGARVKAGWRDYGGNTTNILTKLWPEEKGVSVTVGNQSLGGQFYLLTGEYYSLESSLIVGVEYLISGYIKQDGSSGSLQLWWTGTNNAVTLDGGVTIVPTDWTYFEILYTHTGANQFLYHKFLQSTVYMKDMNVSPVVHRVGRHGFINTSYTDLIINTDYYVDEWGGLWPSNAVGRTYVGRALSSTELLIKG